ncbi:hypothetical protein AB1L88_25790 [Tautonia sp. JC769]|uniref:hypothetical protein n=1 Tax=Tautonia sp. JC769 TaxID=3232135 RepID=UPI00345ACCF7
MNASKKENLFARLAQQTAKHEDSGPATEPVTQPPAPEPVAIEPPPSPAPPEPAPSEERKPKPAPVKRKTEPVTGKRTNPEYCQANAYVPKALRREVDRALLDIDGLDYSTLVEDLLRKWLKSNGVSA